MTTLYHNPRCSKSRQALQVLQQANEPVEIVLYLKDILSEDALKKILQQLGVSAIDLVNGVFKFLTRPRQSQGRLKTYLLFFSIS